MSGVVGRGEALDAHDAASAGPCSVWLRQYGGEYWDDCGAAGRMPTAWAAPADVFTRW